MGGLIRRSLIGSVLGCGSTRANCCCWWSCAEKEEQLAAVGGSSAGLCCCRNWPFRILSRAAAIPVPPISVLVLRNAACRAQSISGLMLFEAELPMPLPALETACQSSFVAKLLLLILRKFPLSRAKMDWPPLLLPSVGLCFGIPVPAADFHDCCVCCCCCGPFCLPLLSALLSSTS